MYFAYHCYLAQPIQDGCLIRFLENVDILYTDNSTPISNDPRANANTSQNRYQNEKPLLAMFTDEGEQAPGAKTIFYVLRMLSLLVSVIFFYSRLRLLIFILKRIDSEIGKTYMKLIARRLHSSTRVSQPNLPVRERKRTASM